MTYVQPLCDEIQGEDSFGYFYGLEQVEQHMVSGLFPTV